MNYVKTTSKLGTEIIAMAMMNKITDNMRIVWRGKTPSDNVIFVATGQSLIDMITDTVDINDIFDIWMPEDQVENLEK